jgi:hypothetical protein
MWHIDRNWHVWYTPTYVAPGNPNASYFHGDYIEHSVPFRHYLLLNAEVDGPMIALLEAWND